MTPDYISRGILFWSLYLGAHYYFQKADPWRKPYYSEDLWSKGGALIVAFVGTFCLFLWPVVLPLCMLWDIREKR